MNGRIVRIVTILFDMLEIYLPVAIFVILIFSVAIQVFFRYALNTPLPKVFELTIYSFVWTIYLGATLARRYRMHMRFDILYRYLPRKAQIISDLFFDILLIIVFLIILPSTIEYASFNYRVKSSALRIPWTYLLLCFIIFLVLTLIHTCTWIWLHVCELLGKKIPVREQVPWH
ncbi:MAG: TRAP transporter small permease subunit [Deltaproteobacteria bacterium]|nr:TRAP transporter small permease subunit [Deltaproteobacteria bacterium]